MEIASAFDVGRVAERKILQALGQIGRGRHAGAVDQHRNDRNVLFQSGLKFDPDRVAFFPNLKALAFARSEPLRPDDHEHQVAAQQFALDVLAEIGSEWNVVDVHEDGLIAEMPGEPVTDAAGDGVGILTADRRSRSLAYEATGPKARPSGYGDSDFPVSLRAVPTAESGRRSGGACAARCYACGDWSNPERRPAHGVKC